MARTTPLPSYNYLVKFVGGPRIEDKLLGGFSDVSGLKTETHISEYRDGNEPQAHVRKVPGSHKVGDVTLKRGVVDSSDLWDWVYKTQTQGFLAQRDVIITLLDEAGKPQQSWYLRSTVPLSYTGPTLAGKGGGEVAMEELVLAAEGFEMAKAS